MSAMAAASMLVPQTAPRPGVVGCSHRPGCLPRPGVSLRVHRHLSRSGRLLTVPASAAVDAPPTTGDLKPKSKEAELAIDAIRFLAIDGVNQSKSGHPGMPMGCAPMSYVLWKETMNVNPRNPKWPNRDRFVLSAGHGSMLQYSLLHLCGFPVGIEDLKQFRQWGSITPGHPENFETAGVEVTTGPLGQGIANAVGLALAESHMAARFNKPDLTLVDNYTYCILGDGCNMEGISNEAASLAGHWKLGKLVAFYDDNRISIDGHTDISFTEDVLARYDALGWHTIHVKDGNHDLGALREAIAAAKAVTDKPTIIKVSTTIGYGSPNKADSHDVHGSPLGASETEATRENLHWPYGAFEVPEEAYKAFSEVAKRGEAAEAAWEETRKKYAELHPDAYAEYEAITYGHLPAGWADALPKFTSADKGLATRLHSQTMLNALSPVLPGLIGGSADLAGSCMTLVKTSGDYQAATPAERNLRFGVREHAMGAIANGIALYAPGFFPYVATFFIFTDYMRNAIRMAALSQAGVLFVMTHDSVGLGEDGPTHQPIEHLASFRAMPNILMLRPGDGNETAGAYKVAVENASGINSTGKVRPSVMAFSRQGMPNMDTTSADGVAHGAYVVAGTPLGETPEVILVGTGSELVFAVEAGKKLESEGIKARVVSMPCWELFDEQSDEYKSAVFPPEVKARVSIEAGSTFGWIKYLGPDGYAIGIDHFGNSAPGPVLYEKYGFTADNVAAKAKEILAGLN